MFKGDNKNTRTTSLTLFWCFYCHLWTYFTPFSSVFIADFEQSNVSSNVFTFKRKVLCDMLLENQHVKVIKSNLLIYQEYYCFFFFTLLIQKFYTSTMAVIENMKRNIGLEWVDVVWISEKIWNILVLGTSEGYVWRYIFTSEVYFVNLMN